MGMYQRKWIYQNRGKRGKEIYVDYELTISIQSEIDIQTKPNHVYSFRN